MTASGEGDDHAIPLSDGRPTHDDDDRPVPLRAHTTRPGKTVFTEPDNSDGWLATDFTV